MTLFFWIPAAVRMGYLYFTNANLADAFVSRPVEESESNQIGATGEALGTELIRAADGLTVHEIRDTIERYAGLANAARVDGLGDQDIHPLLEAAGRGEDGTGSVCMSRRNQNRLERHYKWARQDFLMLFEYLAEHPSRIAVYKTGLEFTRLLGDDDAHKDLEARLTKGEEIWTQEPDARSTAIFPKPVPSIAATTTLYNRD
jgi:hypothetical protein